MLVLFYVPTTMAKVAPLPYFLSLDAMYVDTSFLEIQAIMAVDSFSRSN